MTCSEKEQLLLTALEESQSLFVAMLHENRAKCEIEEQMVRNRSAIEASYQSVSAHVQLPEPVAKVERGGLKWHIPDSRYSLPVRYSQGTHKLYTEQQVRELLAAHGIQEQST